MCTVIICCGNNTSLYFDNTQWKCFLIADWRQMSMPIKKSSGRTWVELSQRSTCEVDFLTICHLYRCCCRIRSLHP